MLKYNRAYLQKIDLVKKDNPEKRDDSFTLSTIILIILLIIILILFFVIK